jgi:hypothetical protein
MREYNAISFEGKAGKYQNVLGLSIEKHIWFTHILTMILMVFFSNTTVL